MSQCIAFVMQSISYHFIVLQLQLFINIIQAMNKDITIGNKIIYQKMHRKERLRHLQKLNEIKTKPSPLNAQHPSFFKQPSYSADSEKNLEVQRNNIALFNKIASILNEKPRIEYPKSRSFVKSVDQALQNHQKKMIELKTKNENLIKRLNRQQPTINNEILSKERAKNQRYLSFIGKYPFRPHRRAQTDFSLSINEKEELFHQKSLDFDISIKHCSQTDEYVFTVKDLADNRQYSLKMEGDKFKEEFLASGMSYELMVGRLRMQKNGCMKFMELESTNVSKSRQK